MARLYDISVPVGPGLAVWPGDAPYRLQWRFRLGVEGSPVNVGTLTLSTHGGTHADAPAHFVPGGRTAGDLGLLPYLGPARVVEAAGARALTAALVAAVRPRRGERLLWKTRAAVAPHVFPEAFAHLEPDAARLLAAAGVLLVGVDGPSVDPLDSKALPAHHALAEGGVAILENLDLSAVPPGRYELIALPLRLEEGDASPVRAVLRAV